MDVTTNELEAFPGPLCRVNLADGRVLARNGAMATLLGRRASMMRLLGQQEFEALVAELPDARHWAERVVATPIGRLRLRLRGAGDDTGLLALEPVPPRADREEQDLLLEMVADLRWQWDLAENRAFHYGAGLLTSGIGGDGLPHVPGALIEVVHPDDRDRVEANAVAWLEGRTAHYREEFRIRNDYDASDAQWRWVLSRGRIVERDEQGRAVRAAGLITDITARRARESEQAALEAQLRHVQKLDALGQLTGGIAHDFNNILASVLGYSELASMLVASAVERAPAGTAPESEQVASYLTEIRSAADRGRELIAKMLMFSRGGPQGDVSDRLAPLSLVEDTVRMLRPMLPATLDVRLELARGLPPLAVDPTQLQQLLLNLVINARDAVGENGSVVVRAEAASPQPRFCASCAQPVHPGGDEVALTVSDDGPGIPRAVREKIFDPFFTTKEAGRGSGLGLSVVHGIVHEHGGHLCVESSDEGTSIMLVLPSTEEVVHPEEGAPPPACTDGRGRRVLIVDDEAPIARWIGSMLERSGFVADIYEDPERALRRFHYTPEHWDLVITDQAMPGLSGVELADELLARTPDLPIIICSGYSEFVDASNAGDFGFRAFLDKPVSGDALLRCVDRVLDVQQDLPFGSPPDAQRPGRLRVG